MAPVLASKRQPEDLVAVADHDRLERADTYTHLARDFAEMGEQNLADVFAELAEQSRALLPDTLSNSHPGPVFDPPHAESHDLAIDATSCRTAYDAWAFAVGMEQQAANKLVALLIRARDPRVKLLLMGRIREAYNRAAAYRVYRRAAYHSERIDAVRAAFPDTRRIHDDVELALVALVIERWFLRLLQSRDAAAKGYHDAMAKTRSSIERLEALAGDTNVPRRLSKWLDHLNALQGEKRETQCSARFLNLKLTAEAGRIFDYYDRVFEEAEEAEIMALAQSLSADAVCRLQSVRTALQ